MLWFASESSECMSWILFGRVRPEGVSQEHTSHAPAANGCRVCGNWLRIIWEKKLLNVSQVAVRSLDLMLNSTNLLCMLALFVNIDIATSSCIVPFQLSFGLASSSNSSQFKFSVTKEKPYPFIIIILQILFTQSSFFTHPRIHQRYPFLHPINRYS